jgi:hypothetical protein
MQLIGDTQKIQREIKMATKTATYWRETEEGDEEITVELPASWHVCPDCSGRGTTYLGWAAKDQPAFSAEELWDDPDFAEDYMSGGYDQQCPGCKGRTTVLEIDWDSCLQSSNPEIQEAAKAVLAAEEDQRELEAMYASERRMGA